MTSVNKRIGYRRDNADLPLWPHWCGFPSRTTCY